MSEEMLQSPAIDPMRHGEYSAFVETSVRNEYMQVGIEPQKISCVGIIPIISG